MSDRLLIQNFLSISKGFVCKIKCNCDFLFMFIAIFKYLVYNGHSINKLEKAQFH